jgi:hypothetical protein
MQLTNWPLRRRAGILEGEISLLFPIKRIIDGPETMKRPLLLLVLALISLGLSQCRADDLLVYTYSGTTTLIGGGLQRSIPFNGELVLDASQTNGAFIVWETYFGHKIYAVNPITNYLVATLAGPGTQSFTLFGAARLSFDSDGSPRLNSSLLKGQNARLLIGKSRYYSFPSVFTAVETEVSEVQQISQLALWADHSTYIFSPARTQACNNANQSVADVVAAVSASLQKKGYAQ